MPAFIVVVKKRFFIKTFFYNHSYYTRWNVFRISDKTSERPLESGNRSEAKCLNSVAEFFSGTKFYNVASLDFDRFTGLGITTFAGFASNF